MTGLVAYRLWKMFSSSCWHVQRSESLTWRVDRSGLTTPINHFTVIGLLTVHLEWFHQWDGDAPTLGTQFRIDQPNITTEAFLASVEPELRGRERWLRLTAVVIGVPIFRGESVLR